MASNGGVHNAWIGEKGAGGFDLRSKTLIKRSQLMYDSLLKPG